MHPRPPQIGSLVSYGSQGMALARQVEGAHYCAVMEAVLGAASFAFNGNKASFIAAVEAPCPPPDHGCALGQYSEDSANYFYDNLAAAGSGCAAHERLEKIMDLGLLEGISRMKGAMALKARLAELAAGPPAGGVGLDDVSPSLINESRGEFIERCEADGLSLADAVHKWRQVCEKEAMKNADLLLQKIAGESVEVQEVQIKRMAS